MLISVSAIFGLLSGLCSRLLLFVSATIHEWVSLFISSPVLFSFSLYLFQCLVYHVIFSQALYQVSIYLFSD